MENEELVMSTSNGTPKQLKKHEELVYGHHFNADVVEQLKFLKDLPYKEGDMMLCSYPKCGTHWVNNLMRSLRKKSQDEPDQPTIGLFEFATPEKINSVECPRSYTTHIRPRRYPRDLIDNKARLVFVVRNPKDVAVSFYHHLKKSVMFNNPQTWNEFFESFITGVVPWGSYLDYLEEWNTILKDPETNKKGYNVELFYYEDLKVNGLDNVRRLNKFLGFERTDDELKEIETACSFDKLKEKTNSEKDKIFKGLQAEDGSSVIFRKGDIGDWKNYFTVAQNERFDALLESRLKDSIFKFRYE